MSKNLKPVITVAGVALALSITFSGLVACGDKSGNGDDTTTAPSIYQTDADGSTYYDTSAKDTTAEPQDFQSVDETVWVIVDSVNLRESPSSTSKVVAYPQKGDSFRRVKYNEKWSAVIFDGKEYYISSDCLSTQDPSNMNLTFNPVDYVVYVTVAQCNLRDYPSTEEGMSNIVYIALNAEELVAIGLSTDGKWYKVLYTEKETAKQVTCYVSASVVSKSRVDEGFTDVTKTVYVTAEQLNIRTAPTADDASTIIAAAVKGTALQVVGVNAAGTWYKIRYTVDGTEGFYYISAKYTSETAPK